MEIAERTKQSSDKQQERGEIITHSHADQLSLYQQNQCRLCRQRAQ